MATSEGDRELHEWPPHPARLFSALVATWADTDEPAPSERSALEWLERIGPPDIFASDVPAGYERTPVTHFVPINDTSVVGLSETVNRAAKLAELSAALITEQGKDSPNRNRIAKIVSDQARQLDVTKKTETIGTTKPDDAIKLLPGHRPKQARHWPSVCPRSSDVSFIWPTTIVDDSTHVALDAIAERLVRVGHSSSLVAARFTIGPAHPGTRLKWTPDPEGDVTLRWVQPGQLAALERRYAEHLASKPRTMPKLGVRYCPARTDVAAIPPTPVRAATSGEWLPLAFVDHDRRLPARRAVEVAKAARGALLRFAPDARLPLLSGHSRDGGKLIGSPHIAVLPIPFVAGSGGPSAHASGQLMGIAIIVPDGASDAERDEVLRAAAAWRSAGFRLELGRTGVLHLTSDTDQLRSLDERSWTGPSRTWASATPIALPRHPGDPSKGNPDTRARRWLKAERIIGQACEHVGVPHPTSVHLSRSPILAGSDHARNFPAYKQRDDRGNDQARFMTHARLVFDVPVTGPLAIGSGRFYGLGLMRSIKDDA